MNIVVKPQRTTFTDSIYGEQIDYCTGTNLRQFIPIVICISEIKILNYDIYTLAVNVPVVTV